LFAVERQGGRRDRVAAGPVHPVLGGGGGVCTRCARRSESGLSSPTEIVDAAARGGREPLYPWEPAPAGGSPAEAVVLRARISEVVFTERRAAAAPAPAAGAVR